MYKFRFYHITILFMIGLCAINACKQNPNKKNNSIASPKKDSFAIRSSVQQSLNGYDSIKYFKDVSWINLQGQSQFQNDSLDYPFVAYCYHPEFVDLYLYFTKKYVIKWRLRNTARGKLLHLKRYVKGERGMVHYYVLFREKESFWIESNQDTDTIQGSLSFRQIERYTLLDQNTLKEEALFPAYGYRNVPLKSIIEFNLPTLSKHFEQYIFRIIHRGESGGFYQLYKYSKVFTEDSAKETKKAEYLNYMSYQSFIFSFARQYDQMLFKVVMENRSVK